MSKRVFVYDGREFPDPDAALSVDEVRQSMAVFFPELANAKTVESKKDGNDVYSFEKQVGTKGYGTVETGDNVNREQRKGSHGGWAFSAWKINHDTNEVEELNDADREHIAQMIRQGETKGKL